MYSVTRGGTLGFEHVPVDGSTKIEDALMEAIEPFDFGEAVDFQAAYLAGYLADKYDVDSEESIKRANDRIRKSTEKAFAATVQGYTSVSPESVSIRLQKGKIQYALYPVWLLNTSWNGKKYTFAMNGQTGKMTGEFPICPKKSAAWFAGLWAASAALVSLVQLLL